MFQGLKNGWQLVKESVRIFYLYPQLFLPILLTWSIYAPIVIYFKYFFVWENYSNREVFWISFAIIFTFAFLLSFSCSVLLELLQQLETGKNLNIFKAFFFTISQNLLKMFPLIFIWTIIWFSLLLIEVILSKEDEEDESLSYEDVAKTLAGYDSISFSEGFFGIKTIIKALKKGVRMLVFLILPATAWEELGFCKSLKKGFQVFKVNLSTFVSGFVLTSSAACIIFLPPAVLFYLSDEAGVVFPEAVWLMTIIYIAFAWSYAIYLEQMFCAELYLWHLKWEKEVKKLKSEEKELPDLKDIPRPSILDQTNDLLFTEGK